MLNVLKKVGIVFVAVSITVPAPGVHVLPATVFTARLAAVRIPPAVIVIVPFFVVPPIVTVPDTVRVPDAVNTSMPLPLPVGVPLAVPICKLAQAELPLTVTVTPFSIITISPAPGNAAAPPAAPPEVVDHVVLVFQLPPVPRE